MFKLFIFCSMFLTYGCRTENNDSEFSQYYSKEDEIKFLKAIRFYENHELTKADSLFSQIIITNKKVITIKMPFYLNPYYFRGHLAILSGNYEKALFNFDRVASDTTTDTDILLARLESFRMLHQYDTAISLSGKLLKLSFNSFDSAIALSERAQCYFSKKDFTGACRDFLKAKTLHPDSSEWMSEYLKNCR